MSKLVSVIMPAYNSGSYIGEAVQSIIDQTYPLWELLIMDDCSGDNTAEIIEGLKAKDKRIRLYRSLENMGIAKQLNKALGECRGEYVCRMDSDDISHPERIQEQLDLLEGSPDAGLCMTGYRLFSDKGPLDVTVNGKEIDSGMIKAEMLRDLPVCGASFFARRELFGSYRFNEELMIAEDYDLFSRMILRNGILNIPRVLYYYRKHGNSITDNPASWKSVKIDSIRKRYLENTGIRMEEEQFRFFIDFITPRTNYQVNRHFFTSVKKIRRAFDGNGYFEKRALDNFFSERLREYLLVTKEYAFFSFVYLLLDHPSFFTRYPIKESLKVIVRSLHG